MIILDERKFAENCLDKNDIGENPYFTLSTIAKYYYHICGYKKKKIYSLLLEFIKKNYSKYELNEFSWLETIDKISKNAHKYPLFEISGVKITKSEMKTIKSIKNKVLERLIFTMLCLAKLHNIQNPKNNSWVNTEIKDIFKLARIDCTSDKRDIKINELYSLGLLEFPKRIGNLNCRVTFVDNDDEEELFISDFRELGYEYRLYCGENFIRCAECGILTRGNKRNTKKYCKECIAYKPMKTKKIICVDCGKEFEVASKDNQSCRCANCYTVYRRNYYRENKRKQRKNI